MPTLADAAQLTPDSDFSAFVGQGVDKSVQRLALKKLFTDPHFNVMDKLDMYMDDYNIPSPVSAEMLASLDHARSALRRFVDEEVADPANPQAPACDEVRQEARLCNEAAHNEAAHNETAHNEAAHNEAAHAAATHEQPLPGEAPCAAPLHDDGPFHRPNPQLPQGQA